MTNSKKSLNEFISGARSVGILGVGSELRADDAAGMLVAELLQIYESKKTSKVDFRIFFGATAPENLTGEIKKYAPSHLIIVDTAELGKKPGTVMLLDKDSIANFSFSTHKLPIKVMIEYLRQSFELEVAIIGVQPKLLDFGKPPCEEVKIAVNAVAEDIMSALEGKK
jgi:hydrogenase 3 maturation protease